MPPLNPWLQRLLLAWAASTVSTGVIVASADNRNRPKKARRRRKRSDDDDGQRAPRPPKPVLLGTVAKGDAAAPVAPSMTWSEWSQAVTARGTRLLRFISGRGPVGAVDQDGSRLPDDVIGPDGKTIKVAPQRRRKKGGPPERKRGQRRKQATLFDSAKESLRQVVKDEAKKAVDEKVEQAGLKKAADAFKSASEKVGETAKDVAQRVKDAVPEDANEKIQSAGRSVFAEAKRRMQQLGETLQAEFNALDDGDGDGRDRGRLNTGDTGDIIDVGTPPAPPADVDAHDSADGAAMDGISPPTPSTPETSATTSASSSMTTTSTPADPPLATPGLDADGLVESIGEGVQKLGGGVQKIGSFLSGPGNPGYQRNQNRSRAASGDVVEAKDAPTGQPPVPPTAPEPTPAPPSDPE